MTQTKQDPFAGLRIAFALMAILPDLTKAIAETIEAVQAATDDERPVEEKIKEAEEAGVAWLDLAKENLKISKRTEMVLRSEAIPGFASFLFYLAEDQVDPEDAT